MTRSPREVFLALVHGVADRDLELLPSLYAEQTDVIHPFDPDRAPAMRTRDELRAHFTKGLAAARDIRREVVGLRIHETADPEVVIAEFAYRTTVPATGETFDRPAIFVLRVRDGEIVESRDYVDHRTSARA
jgi:ketosteroid isomerase-like protein